MIRLKVKGSFKNTERFLKKMTKAELFRHLDSFGRRGVDALSAATPVDSGMSASSWDYEIDDTGKTYSITWLNYNLRDGIPIVILLQYGHGTGTGGYVQGQDFINPAIKPIFDQIANGVWKVVTSA